MSALYLVLAWLLGVVTIPLAMVGIDLADEAWRSFQEWKRKRRDFGKWIIYSHAGSGSDYSNGGRFTICREGFYDLMNPKCEWITWNPPMKDEAEALAECDRRNALLNSTPPAA